MILKTFNYFKLVIRFLIWIFGNIVKKVLYWSNYAIKLYTIKKFLIPILLFLRDFSLTTGKTLIDLTAVDYQQALTSRFHLHYFILSMQYNVRYQVSIPVRYKETVPTSSKIFLSSLWSEREVWNMFGIRFVGNKTMRSILTDYGFRSHPLLKNFPMSGYVEHQYDETQRAILRKPVKLMQEYRMFTSSFDSNMPIIKTQEQQQQFKKQLNIPWWRLVWEAQC